VTYAFRKGACPTRPQVAKGSLARTRRIEPKKKKREVPGRRGRCHESEQSTRKRVRRRGYLHVPKEDRVCWSKAHVPSMETKRTYHQGQKGPSGERCVVASRLLTKASGNAIAPKKNFKVKVEREGRKYDARRMPGRRNKRPRGQREQSSWRDCH